MKQYQNNSDAARNKPSSVETKNEDVVKKKDIQKVTTGGVRTKKKSKLRESFIAKDVQDVGDYIINDVLIPTLKRTVADMVSNGIDMALFGEVRSRGRSHSNNTRGDRRPYRSFYESSGRRYDSRDSRRPAYDYESVIVESRGEADLVLDRMDEIIDKFDAVTITDLYDLVGYDGGRFTDSKYGWTSLRNVDIKHLRDGGYEIILPEPKQVD